MPDRRVGDRYGYLRRTYRTTEAEEERLVAELWQRGSLGTQTLATDPGHCLLVAWFPQGAEPPDPPGFERLEEAVVADQDWLAPYRAWAQPFAVGRRLLIDPREPDAAPPEAEGRQLLRLPARTAFGTGSHETTRLVLEWLEDLDLAATDLLDVGTGSGILALAALLGGARRVVAIDVDPAAALIAGQYARANRLPAPEGRLLVLAGGVAALAPAPRFHWALVNVLPHRILPHAREVVARVRPQGRLVVSGMLVAEAPEVLAAWRRAGAEPLASRTAGEWQAWQLRRAGEEGR
ncbi:MAG TPA: 50S ribosomal protein L11 methyltransferase [Thermoanaerobaculia bacterium]|nr:50S ribosomal protein L11 methyltransferase [Thermoanaerobaculia bacterium]